MREWLWVGVLVWVGLCVCVLVCVCMCVGVLIWVVCVHFFVFACWRVKENFSWRLSSCEKNKFMQSLHPAGFFLL